VRELSANRMSSFGNRIDIGESSHQSFSDSV